MFGHETSRPHQLRKINMIISVIGLGKLGLCIACIFAEHFKVIGIDTNEKHINALISGTNPIKEKGLDLLFKDNRKNITFTNSFEDLGDIVFVIVPTPSIADNTFTSAYVESALQEIGTKKTVVIVSTVMPGETMRMQKKYPQLNLIYSPTFIALGSVIADFICPDFILMGTDSKKDLENVSEIYKKACAGYSDITVLSTLEAEIAKLTLNCYVTAKITFANQIGNLCYRLGITADNILKAVGQDSRIGNLYFKAGLGYGGPCFPRDNLAMIAFMKKMNANPRLLQTVHSLNYEQIKEFVDRVIKLKPTTVGFEGISYKSGTDITEQSQLAKIKSILGNKGYRTIIGKGDVNVGWEGIKGE